MEKPRQPPRHFTQQEAELILRRAARLDVREAGAELSIEELERIAADAGIAPENIRRAAESLEAPQPLAPKSHFFGEPTSVLVERTLPVQLTPGSLEVLASQMNDLLGGSGTVVSDGQRLSWTRKLEESGSLPTKVTLWNSGGRLRVQLRASNGSLAGGLYGGVGGGVGGGLGIPLTVATALLTHSIPGSVGVFLGVVAGGWGLARAIYVNAARHRRARWEQTMRELCEHITGLSAREEQP
jgi:hypothetical protein